MVKLKSIPLIFLLLLSLASFSEAGAQDTLSRWLRYDVNLALQPDAVLVVEEVHQVVLSQGATHYTRVIPADRLVLISHVQVLEVISGKGRYNYQQADTQADYTFEVMPASEREQMIVLHFPPNNTASTTFIIQYFVTGALRFYPEGEQLDWQPFGPAATAPIDLATVTLKLPVEVPPEQLKLYSQGVPTERFLLDATRASFKAIHIGQGDSLEVSWIIPHNLVSGSPPPWQLEADALEFWTPILQGGSILLAFLILLLGTGAIYGWWYIRTHGAKSFLKKTPKGIKSPPRHVAPAMAGVLLDGQAEPRHIMATFLDLANRNVLHIYPVAPDPVENKKSKRNFNLYAVDPQKATAPYESALYGKIFGYVDAQKRDLAGVRQALFMATSELKGQINLEAIKLGYLSKRADIARRQYSAFGAAAFLISSVLTLLAGLVFAKFTYLVACPFLSMAIVAGIFTVTGFRMPQRAAAGVEETDQWEKFRYYLKNLSPQSAAKSSRQFAHLLPYAVAFGVEKDFIEKFAAAGAPIPSWWNIPAEKLPDITHEESYAWVSATVMAQAQSQPQAERQKTKSVIHRLGTPRQPGSDHLLKDIKPTFIEFLHLGHEVFTKVYLGEEEQKINFEALEQDSEKIAPVM